MKTKNEKLLNWAIDKILKEYKEDVCLLIGTGQFKLEQDKDVASFDYFIPANEKAHNLAKTFIVEGIGYDLYPRSWERIEKMANLDDYNTTCLGYAQILYYRNEEDKNRFLAMQAKLQANLKNPEFMFKKALEKLNIAMEIYQTMMFEDRLGKVRMASGFIADYLSVAVAFVNQTYFKYSQINQISELSVMKEIPQNFMQYYTAIIHADSVDELKNLCHVMILSTRKFMSNRKPKNENKIYNEDFHDLADWYQELCYTWRRIYYWCDQRDAEKTFVWSCYLQRELDIVKEEFGLKEMDLCGKYSSENLLDFRKRAEELEKYIIDEIHNHGVAIDEYNSIEEFMAKNS
ncbi:hypothetical protein [Desnuesiella massiliensis]|uniref:hypothetical protein n=1 Tax=Desnuesiella massiliensis TaxID=1650662 RepID=UPI0006E2ADFD|nr:hypothetical protein [Desnuesiella massiliensis]